MEYINENLKTPVCDDYDVIVVGGGPAGCGTAIACGRSGLKTLIIEKFNCLGGAWTTGIMNPFFDCRDKNGIVGVFRRGNKPPVLLGEDKKL
ncbi:MAG: FAD-dependent oxidoreductase [Monoglobaceae bacterium]